MLTLLCKRSFALFQKSHGILVLQPHGQKIDKAGWVRIIVAFRKRADVDALTDDQLHKFRLEALAELSKEYDVQVSMRQRGSFNVELDDKPNELVFKLKAKA